MLRGIFKPFSFSGYFVFYILLLMSCRQDQRKIDVSETDVSVSVESFESDLAANKDNASILQKKYGSFFDLFNFQIIRIGTDDTLLLKTRIADFLNDPDIRQVYADVKNIFQSREELNRQFTDAFKHFNYYFPDSIIPRVISYVSGFNYAIVSADSVLGIGLDMYLGSDSKYYPGLGLPSYKIRKMSREYVVADAMRGWVQSEWEQPAQGDLISQFIYQGSIQYLLDYILPETPDSVKMGYTAKQLDWCVENERMVWSFFIDHNLLFVTDARHIGKYTGDAPTTNGFPQESPGNIGEWVGLQIVKAYMEKHPGMTLSQLINEPNLKKIFLESNYKPKK